MLCRGRSTGSVEILERSFQMFSRDTFAVNVQTENLGFCPFPFLINNTFGELRFVGCFIA